MTFSPQTSIKGSDIRRFSYISDWALDVLTSVSVMNLEGYAMRAKGKVFDIGENTALLKYKLMLQNKTPILIEPTRLKKYATGKGNADKQLMYEAFVAKTDIKLKELIQPNRLLGNPTTDMVDAFYLAGLCF